MDYMQSGKVWDLEPRKQRQVQPIDVTMHQVEFGRALRHNLEQCRLRHDRVGAGAAEAKRRAAMPRPIPHLLPSRRWQTASPDGQAQSVSHATTRSVPRYHIGGTLSASGAICAITPMR